MLIDNLALFLQIVEKGSLTAAGREVGLSPTTVSERLASLESHFGVVLLNRTTRAISLTEEGRAVVEGAHRLLDELSDLETRIRLGTETLTGLIKISTPSDSGRTIVSDAIHGFLKRHPGVRIELILSDGYVDLVAEGVDLALRFGPTEDSTLRVKGLGESRQIVCAAPSYIEKYGMPIQPEDLKTHNCIVRRYGQNLDNVWHFSRGASEQFVTVSGDRIANDGALVRQWGLKGYGVIWKLEVDVCPDIRAGRLIELLPDYPLPVMPYQILFPPARAQPRRVNEFADYLVSVLENNDAFCRGKTR